jgi:hypothetical protein
MLDSANITHRHRHVLHEILRSICGPAHLGASHAVVVADHMQTCNG